MDVVILGAGSHGRDVECIAYDCGRFVNFLDDDPARGHKPTDSFLPPTVEIVIGAWEPQLRAAMWRDHQAATLIHPAARVGRGCKIAPGCVIGPGAVLTNDVQLGAHVHVGAGAILTRCTIGDFSTVSNGATVLGDVTVGERVLIGGNAVVRNLLTIHNGAVIGCGANVIRDVEAATAVAGNPAKTLGRLP